MKKNNRSLITKGLIFCALAVSFLLLLTALLNLDLVLRLFNAYKNGALTGEKLLYELDSYDIGLPIPAASIANSKVSPKDGMTQLYIPAGEFTMGIDNNTPVDNPGHRVYLDSYWMDKLEITNAMYAKCVNAGVCTSPAVYNTYYGNWVYRDYPVVYVNWYQADQYCRWSGRSLPSEAQWEKAARGTDGRKYPWGNESPNPTLANFNSSFIGEPVPVFRYPLGASPYGVLNMSGNVREWVADWYDPGYYLSAPYSNPPGPATGTERTLRAGSYAEDQNQIAVFHRFKHLPDSAGLSRGFRCAETN